MCRSVAMLLVLCLTGTAEANRIYVEIVGHPPADVARGLELGSSEMQQTAKLLGADLSVAAGPRKADQRLVGAVLFEATTIPARVPQMHLASGSVGGIYPPAGSCGFAIQQRDPRNPKMVAWLPTLNRYGASELNERYQRRFNTPMSAGAWTGWFAVKALVESALRTDPAADLCTSLSGARFDGHKGEPLVFDTQTRELRQPMYAYVSNELAGTVSVIDLSRDVVVRTMKINGRPRGIEAAGTTLHVAVSDVQRERRGTQDAIVALDANSGRELKRYDAGTDPERFVVSRDGRRLYAANEDAGTATITDIRTNKVIVTLVVGVEPEGVAISPDGHWVYVTAETSNTVSVIDTARGKVVSSMLVDPRPRDAAFSPDGARAYVTAEIGGSVSVVDARRHKVLKTVPLPPPAKPVGVTVSPDGKTVYVATGHGNSVLYLDAGDLRVLASVPVGRRPWGIALSPDGRRLYTANGVSGDVSVVDTAARREIKRIPTGAGAWGVAVAR